MAEIDKNPRQITRLRVEDQKKLEELATKVVYNKDTDTTEIGTSLEVNGQAIFNADIKSYNGAGLFLYDNVGDSENVNIWAGVSDKVLYIDYGNEGNPDLDVSVQIPLSSNSTVLTTANTKTLFGNQSLYGTGNINLYVHYLSIIANNKFYYGVIYSSNNITADSPQKLTTLFKATPGTAVDCIILSDIDNNTVGLLKWNGDIWQIQLANDNFATVTSVTDRVEPI